MRTKYSIAIATATAITDMCQVRRFQIRLAQKDQFYEVVKVLSRANVPTTDAGHGNGQRSLGSQNSISQIAHRTAPQLMSSTSRAAPPPSRNVNT